MKLVHTRLAPALLCCMTLAGCASSQSANVANTKAATTPTPVAVPATLAIKNTHPQSGDSISGRTDYLRADGSLSPYLQQWANELSRLQSIPLSTVEGLLKQANYNAEAVKLMRPNKGRIKRSWSTYKNRVIEPIRLQAGLDFWQQHHSNIQHYAQQYGVPPEIIVAIIGIETIYGRYTGGFKVLDVLLSLGFSYPDNSRPERGQLFRDQLADLIVLHHQGKLDATQAKGSFAGAMGLPQFMPGSLMRYAVDGDNNGHIDLYGSMPDIFASVANFLIEHGWQPELPVFAPVHLNTQFAQPLVDGGLKPLLTWQQIQQAQAAHPATHHNGQRWMQQPLGIIDLVEESRGTAEYRLATPNFFALTAYNRSYFYAATVADFAQELAIKYTGR